MARHDVNAENVSNYDEIIQESGIEITCLRDSGDNDDYDDNGERCCL